MFHVELRQFPYATRAFNLDREELERRFLGPWLREETIEYGERHWSRDRATMTIYEGPALRPDQIGLGRGWANVTRTGTEVTKALLAEPAPEAVRALSEQAAVRVCKDAILAQLASEPVSLRAVLAIVDEQIGNRRASARLALAEQAVWELLHGRLASLEWASGATIAGSDWLAALIPWDTWGLGGGDSDERAWLVEGAGDG
jgi:hypothetical protein